MIHNPAYWTPDSVNLPETTSKAAFVEAFQNGFCRLARMCEWFTLGGAAESDQEWHCDTLFLIDVVCRRGQRCAYDRREEQWVVRRS